MTSVDTMDIPVIESSERSSKKAKTTKGAFCDRIRGATGWHSTMAAGTWKNCTTDKSRRTLFVLQAPGGGDQFCCVGKVFSARLSREELEQPLPYDTSDEHTELHVGLSLRPSGDNEHWSNYDADITAAAESFAALRTKAIEGAFVPLLSEKPDSMKGITDARLKRGFGKNKKEMVATLENMWGGTGLSGDGDIARLKRKCYSTNDLNNASEFMNNWLSVVDEHGDPVNYIDQPGSIRTGDTVLVWFRVLTQACAGNFHVSLEARQVMRLGRGADGMAEGSAGLAASLKKAMERGDEI
jgi:hypothetical protein